MTGRQVGPKLGPVTGVGHLHGREALEGCPGIWKSCLSLSDKVLIHIYIYIHINESIMVYINHITVTVVFAYSYIFGFILDKMK